MIVPKPRQAAHGRMVRISPRNERCTCTVSPRPPQVSQVFGLVPGAAPSPWQVVHSTAVSTLSSWVVPNAASARSTSSRISASWPRRLRGRGPRPDWAPPAWPPKKASMMSVKENPAPAAPAPPKPPPLKGSPPRSYIRRFSGSESTS